MSSSQHDHSRARRQAVQILYIHEIVGTPLADLANTAKNHPEKLLVVSEIPEGAEEFNVIGEDVSGYTYELVRGVAEHFDDIERFMSSTSDNWAIDRMPVVDRNIIRLAIYEIVFRKDIPTGVAINEAVEVAKAFGGNDSPKFVNGVLGKIAAAFDAGTLDEMEARDRDTKPRVSEEDEYYDDGYYDDYDDGYGDGYDGSYDDGYDGYDGYDDSYRDDYAYNSHDDYRRFDDRYDDWLDAPKEGFKPRTDSPRSDW